MAAEFIDVMAYVTAYVKDKGWEDGEWKLIRFTQSTKPDKYAMTFEFEDLYFKSEGKTSRAVAWLKEQEQK